jgi:NADH-quinone oxidoreductase subunit A
MSESAGNPYLPVLVVAALAAGFAAVLLAASAAISRLSMRGRRRSPVKDTPYECGMPILAEAHTRFSVRFYIVAMLFILFDIEVVFLFPWAVVYGREAGARGGLGPGFLFLELLVFVAVLLVGWLYVVRKGVLEWQSEG